MTKKLVLDEQNFHVKSDDWKEIMVDGKEYLENPEGDVWEILEGDCKGEQLFTWNAAMRETAKADKRMPTNKGFGAIVKRNNISNIVFPGIRSTNGTFHDQGTAAYFWSSSEIGDDAWVRHSDSLLKMVFRGTLNKAQGFSVRCIKT